MKPMKSYIRYSASLLQYSNIHTSSHLRCNKNGDDSEIDWTKISEAKLKQYKYWESPLTAVKNDSPHDNIPADSNNDLGLESKSEYDFDAKNDLDLGNNLGANMTLTHTDQSGKLNMVDVGDKSITSRVAVATGTIILGKEAFQLVKENRSKKGDVLTVAKIAGITGAKKTSDLIPLCHNIPLSKVDIEIEFIEASYSLQVTCVAKTVGKTGVEMEAITGVAMATITIYDMCKAVTKEMIIGDIKLLHKSGGKSGEFNLSQ